MRITIKFGPSMVEQDKSLNDQVNGFIHNVLGPDNKWHDIFSPYSVSTIHGGVFNKESKKISFPEGGRFVIASDNEEFLRDFITGLATINNGKIGTMPYIGFESNKCTLSYKYDIVRIENIRLKVNNKEITCKDDGYIDKLREHSIRKLIRCGVSEEDANTLQFEPFGKDKWKVKYVKMKNGMKNESITPSSSIMLIVKGKKEVRNKMFNLGYGISTGSGFGFATTKKNNI